MPSFRTGVVTEILAQRRGLQRVAVALDDAESTASRAYVLTQLTGPVETGDRVVVNTTAVELGLGTGGWHVVHWNLERSAWAEAGPGHIMKLRYTSLQVDTGAAEEDDDPEHLDGRTLAGLPVVACSLHSQVGVVAATLAALRPGTRVVYVMTDGAGLPLALSDLVAELADRRLVTGTITAGHAFGGDLEAVTVASALVLAQRRLEAEAVIVGMGPGVVGTGTRLGTTAIEVASILDTVAALGGDPVCCPRLSSADERDRHQGVSHHTTTILDLCRSPVTVPWPADAAAVGVGRHRIVPLDVPPVGDILEAEGLRITTMGRSPDLDALFFDAAGAAAAHVASLLGPVSPR